MLRDLEYSELDDKNKGYRMVQGRMVVSQTRMPGMWCASTSLLEDVRLAYRVERRIPSIEESSREFYDILSNLPFLLGILGEEEYDEDLSGSDGDC